MARDLKVPLDDKITKLRDIPYTISYVVRKRMQVDNLNELPKEKRPSDKLIWYGSEKELDNWIENVMKGKQEPQANFVISNIEG